MTKLNSSFLSSSNVLLQHTIATDMPSSWECDSHRNFSSGITGHHVQLLRIPQAHAFLVYQCSTASTRVWWIGSSAWQAQAFLVYRKHRLNYKPLQLHVYAASKAIHVFISSR